MNRQTITFSANEQGLQKTGGITHYASDTISYIDAIFTLGENWNGFDEVRAIFKTPYTCNFAVLNSEGECTVPLEALVNKGSVRVNLVGSIYTEEAVVDRLTTHSVEALIIDEDVPVCGSESAPLEPSEYEQFVAKVANDANRAEAGASDAETSAQNAKTSEDNAKASETLAQTYAQNANNSAISAETAKDEAEDARDEIRSMTATATTLAEGSQATASYSNGVLSLGIPRGDKGNKGDTGASAGFGTVTASVDDTVGTPSVEVTTSGSDTAKNFAFSFHNLKGQKGDTGEVTMEMLEDLLPTDTASGAIASFPDGTNLFSAKSVIDSIEPIQDLHGYDKPWSGGNGKNKIPYPYVDGSSLTINGVTFTVSNDGVVTANGTATANAEFILINVNRAINLPAGTYTLSGLPTGGSGTTFVFNTYARDADSNSLFDVRVGTDRTFTVASDIASLYIGIRIISGYSANNLVIRPQFEQSSTATSWEPYTNICPIYGRTEVVTSDDPMYGGYIEWNQLAYNGDFSAENTTWGYNNADYRKVSIVSGKGRIAPESNQPYLQVLTNQNYYDKAEYVSGHKYLVCGEFTSNATMTKITLFMAENWTNIAEKNMTVGSTTAKFSDIVTVSGSASSAPRFGFTIMGTFVGGTSYIDVDNIMLCDLTQMFGAGNEPTTVDEFKALFPLDYYAYNSGEKTCVSAVNGTEYHSYTTALGQTVYGGTLDVVSGLLTVDRAIVTFDGTEVFNDTYFPTVVCSKGLAPAGIYARNVENKSPYAIYPDIGFASSSAINIQWRSVDDRFGVSSADEFKALLATYYADGKPMEVCYPIATPQTYQLTPQEVDLILGTNNLWCDAGEISVVYKADIQKWVEKKIN